MFNNLWMNMLIVWIEVSVGRPWIRWKSCSRRLEEVIFWLKYSLQSFMHFVKVQRHGSCITSFITDSTLFTLVVPLSLYFSFKHLEIRILVDYVWKSKESRKRKAKCGMPFLFHGICFNYPLMPLVMQVQR